MNDSKHTSGEVVAISGCIYPKSNASLTNCLLMADRDNSHTTPVERDDNIHRVVALWNACLSITNEQLTLVPKLITVCDELCNTVGGVKGVKQLRSMLEEKATQFDLMQVALIDIVENHDDPTEFVAARSILARIDEDDYKERGNTFKELDDLLT